MDLENNHINNLKQIEDLVKVNQFNKAQILLDEIPDKDVEWYYIQAALYYKQGWLMDSKRQLDTIKLMVSGKKYKEAYLKYLDIINYGDPEVTVISDEAKMRSYPLNKSESVAESKGSNCCDCCSHGCCEFICECIAGGL